MVVVSSTPTIGPLAWTRDADAKPIGVAGHSLDRAFERFDATL